VVSGRNTGKNGALCQITFRHRRRVTFSTRRAFANDHFHHPHEKLSGRSNAVPEANSASHAKRIASETMTLHFSLGGQPRRSNGHLLIGKVLWQSQTTHKWLQTALLAHPEISDEKIWYRKNEKLFDHQQIWRIFRAKQRW
jgi:hypothetical protein